MAHLPTYLVDQDILGVQEALKRILNGSLSVISAQCGTYQYGVDRLDVWAEDTILSEGTQSPGLQVSGGKSSPTLHVQLQQDPGELQKAVLQLPHMCPEPHPRHLKPVSSPGHWDITN